MELERMIEIERNIIQIFDECRAEKNLSIEALGKKVYPHEASPYMKIQSLRKPQKNGKPRRLSVGEFMAICEALELDHVRVLIDAAERK
ncbi:MAG: hypothetical protein IJU76_04530 [Desulfovibrionaceae bacterium]|nr:hypothetical protein [Desulfovibrionaceae bacterium]